MTRRGHREGFSALFLLAGLAGPFASAADGSPQASGTVNPMGALPKEALTGFRQRPLFNPARVEPTPETPQPVVAPAASAAVLDPPPSLHLVGIINGSQDLAIVRLDAGGKTSVLSTGDHIAGWNVTVLPTGMNLRQDQRSVDYTLFAHGTPAAVDPAPAASAPIPKGADAFPPTGDPAP